MNKSSINASVLVSCDGSFSHQFLQRNPKRKEKERKEKKTDVPPML
jgi:hypothetical protein